MLFLLILFSMESRYDKDPYSDETTNVEGLPDEIPDEIFKEESKEYDIHPSSHSFNQNLTSSTETNNATEMLEEEKKVPSPRIHRVDFDQVMPNGSVREKVLGLVNDVHAGRLKKSDVMFFFDFDDTIVMSGDQQKESVVPPENQSPRTREMIELLKILNEERIPWCIVTSRGTANPVGITLAVEQYIQLKSNDLSPLYGDTDFFNQSQDYKKQLFDTFLSGNPEKIKTFCSNIFNTEIPLSTGIVDLGISLNFFEPSNDAPQRSISVQSVIGNIVYMGDNVQNYQFKKDKSMGIYHVLNKIPGEQRPRHVVFVDDDPVKVLQVYFSAKKTSNPTWSTKPQYAGGLITPTHENIYGLLRAERSLYSLGPIHYHLIWGPDEAKKSQKPGVDETLANNP